MEKGLRSLSYVSIGKLEIITVETDSADRPGEKGILVLEDEKEIRKLVVTVLDTLGHKIFPAGSISEALQIWESKQNEIQLLISDLSLPDGSGVGFTRHLLSQSAQLKVILMTGSRFNPVDLGIQFNQRAWLLEKPFQVAALKDTVSLILPE
jgi:two-component system cell cycle sensor histidine kinase/response regulator CckA